MRILNKILREFAENNKTTNNKLFELKEKKVESKNPVSELHRFVSNTVSHNISIVTNNELDEYLKHKNRPSDQSDKSKDMMNLNISPKSGFESNTFEKTQNSADAPPENSETPILFLDVNFGNDKLTRIVMYKDDSPRELAKAFCQEHNLSESKQIKLVRIIQHHLKGVLDKIVEEESEEA